MQTFEVILVLIPVICLCICQSHVFKSDETTAKTGDVKDQDNDPHTWTKRIHTQWGDQVTSQHLMPDGSYHWESIGPYGYSSGIYYGNSGDQGYIYSSSNYNGPLGPYGMQSGAGGIVQGQTMDSAPGMAQGQGMAMAQGQGYGMGMVQGNAMGPVGWFPPIQPIRPMQPIKLPKIRVPKFQFAPFPTMQWMPMEPFKWWPSIFSNERR